jgi:uncharacterized protein YqkB
MSKTMPCREEATVQDPLYVYMAAKRFEEYWSKFGRGGIHFSKDLEKLLQGMLAYQPVERMNINDTEKEHHHRKEHQKVPGIKSSAWYNGEVYSPEELPSVLRDRHLVARTQRNRVRNPETEINSVSFRSGTPTVLPLLPTDREFWVIQLDPKATITDAEGNSSQLHPDHVYQQIIQHFENDTNRCAATKGGSQLKLVGEGTGEDAGLEFEVHIDAYQRKNEYFLDIKPVSNWHLEDCKKLTNDVQKYLHVM